MFITLAENFPTPYADPDCHVRLRHTAQSLNCSTVTVEYQILSDLRQCHAREHYTLTPSAADRDTTATVAPSLEIGICQFSFIAP